MEQIMEWLWAYALVFLLSAIPFFEAIIIIPVAIIAGLSTIPTLFIGLVGNMLTVLLVIYFIEQIKAWRNRKKDPQAQGDNKRYRRAQSIWNKYGLPGLAFIGPLFVGSHLTAFVGLLLGGTKKGVTLWMTTSLVAWCIFTAAFAHYGIDIFNIGERGYFNK